MLKDNLISIKGEGSIIGANNDPNIDIDLIFENFDLSFIEKIGSNTMTNISSKVTGEVNLWGKTNNIQHNGKLYLNQSKFKIPYLNIEYLLFEVLNFTTFKKIESFKYDLYPYMIFLSLPFFKI